MTLFDPDDYTAKGATPKRHRTTRYQSQRPGVPLAANATWHLVQQRAPGLVHAHRRGASLTEGQPRAACVTWCGVYATPMTFTRGEVINGCRACLEALQRFGAARERV